MAGLLNCTVSQNGTATIAGGSPVGVKVLRMIISPNSGYVIDYSKFTVGNGFPTSPGTFTRGFNDVSFDQSGTDNDEAINKVVLSNSGVAATVGNTVLVDIYLNETYEMPAAATGLTIDIDGEAIPINVQSVLTVIEPKPHSGDFQTITTAFETTENSTNYGITQTSQNDDTPSTGLRTTVYTISDTIDTNKIVFTKTYAADANYYYSVTPYWENVSNIVQPPFEITEAVTTNADGHDTRNIFTVKYKMPSTTQIGTLKFFADEDLLPNAQTLEIRNYTIADTDIQIEGETRRLIIYGVTGAKVNLSIVSGSDTYDFDDNTFTSAATSLTNAVIGAQFPTDGTGYYEVDIVFPTNATSSVVPYVLTFTAGTSSVLGSDLPTNPLTINQRALCTATFNIIESNSSWTPTSLGTALTQVAGGGKSNNRVPGTFTNAFTVTDDATFYLRRQPLATDITNVTANNMLFQLPKVTTDKPTNHGAGSAGMTSLVITQSDARIDLHPTVDTTCSIDLGALVNSPPTSNALAINVDYETARTFSLSASDPEGDTLTYSTVGSPSSGSLSALNTATGAITYTPNGSFSGSDTFTYKVNDTYEDSNTATVTLTVAGSGGSAVARYALEIYNSSGYLTGTHYIDGTQVCESGSLTGSVCLGFGSLTNKWFRYVTVAAGCGSTVYGRGKLTGAVSDGVPTAYVNENTYFNNSDDSYNNANGTSC